MFHFVMEKMSDTSSNDANLGNFKVNVKNFGPIESANVDLRPLTVFVGKSNTGKTYLATLIYALHQELGGFPRLPFSPNFTMEDILRTWKNQNKDFQKSAISFRNKFSEASQSSNFSELPFIFKDLLFLDGNHMKIAQQQLINCVTTTFGERNLYSLCRNSKRSNTLSIKFGYSEENIDIWNAEIKETKSTTLFQASLLHDISIPSAVTRQTVNLTNRLKTGIELEYPLYSSVERIIAMLCYPQSLMQNYAHYLPAVRGGIMQSHRFVAGAGLDRLAYAGLEDSRAIPHLPKTSIDFIKKLLSIGANTPRVEKNRSRKSHNSISWIADKFEELVLDGQIASDTNFTGGYPEVYFKPAKIDNKFTLSRSSSMVSELAPIVLFIRNFVQQFDLLILEEPEAHLHPGAQVKIAQCLALLVRKGVNVIVTTHSDWFLKCIQNLIIQGKLKQLNIDNSGDDATSYLHRNEVGAWNFTEGINNRGTKVKKIEFHEDSGIEPEDFEDLAFSLHNSVVGGRNLIASKEFSEGGSMGNANEPDIELKKMFTPSDIATQLSVNVERVRRKLKQFGVKPVKGYRFFFDKQEFDILCERIADEIGLNKLAQ